MKFRILRLREVSSTNTLALQYEKKGEPEGLVLTADYQTSGRGKPGRKWVSPRGKDLLFSLLLRPPVPPSRAPLLTQIACRAVAKVLKDHYQISCSFKRPNDIMVGGKKICGVLVEASSGSNGKLRGVVIGVGLNVNSAEAGLPEEAISVQQVTGRSHGRMKMLKEILNALTSDISSLYAHSA